MNDATISHKYGPDTQRQTLIVGNAYVIVSFPANQSGSDRSILDAVSRILFDSYHPKGLSSSSLHFPEE